MTAPLSHAPDGAEPVEASTLLAHRRTGRRHILRHTRSERTSNNGESGFTLIEALVALAIVAIASAGLIGAIERHIDTVGGIERRTAARWVAQNRLAELSLAGEGQTGGGGQVEMLGQQWQVQTSLRDSADPDLRLAEVAVAPAGGQPIVRMRGFIDTNPTVTVAR